MRPIQTTYKGYHFRSRTLAARPPLTRPGVAARKFSAASTVAVAMFEKPHLTGTINALRDAGVDDTAIMEALGL